MHKVDQPFVDVWCSCRARCFIFPSINIRNGHFSQSVTVLKSWYTHARHQRNIGRNRNRKKSQRSKRPKWNKKNATQKSRIKVIEFQQCVSFQSDRIDARTCGCVWYSSMLPSLRARHNAAQSKRKQICLAKVILMIVPHEPTIHTQHCVCRTRGQYIHSKFIRQQQDLHCTTEWNILYSLSQTKQGSKLAADSIRFRVGRSFFAVP